MVDTALAKKNYWLLSICMLSFFMTWSFCFSLYPIWLNQAIGLNGTQSGTVFSLNAVAALLVMPLYGFLQDKLGMRKNLLAAVGVLLIASGPFFIFVYGPLLKIQFIAGAIIGGLYCGITFTAGVGAMETYIERVGRATDFEFGKVRMWGSLGWALASFFAGFLFNISPQINFLLASLCAATFLIAFYFVEPTPTSASSTGDKDRLDIMQALRLFGERKFWAFATFVIGVSCIYTVYDQQFPVYFSAQFASKEYGNAMFGYLNSFQVFLEAGGMFLAPVLVNRVGAKNGLVISGIIMASRMIGSGFADDPVSISAMKLLHAVELPIMLVSVFKYIAATFDTRLASTIYLVGFQFMTQIAASALSVVAGKLYDTIGFADAYILMGSVVSGFVIISAIALTSTPRLAT